MKRNICQKILQAHLKEGRISPGEPISVGIDQTLTQDSTGTMVYLQFEAMNIPRIQVPLAVSYIDHNMLQADHTSADDHLFLESAAAKFGAYFSRAGNGICHQIHLERFAKPGVTLLGSDSHTPTAGAMGALAIGVGGIDVAAAMAGEAYRMTMPRIMGVKLIGELNRPWCMAMDVILHILRKLTVRGGKGWILEYFGPGVKNLSVPERATITNMGAELGATTSIFPSDEITKSFLKAQGRGDDWTELKADDGAEYDKIIEVDLSEIEPLVAMPHSPDNVIELSRVDKVKVRQVCIGSCTNSSYMVMKTVASVLKNRQVAEGVSLAISPGSRQILSMLAAEGILNHMIDAGARILECACGPCVGVGQAPPTNSVSIRTHNRNFKGRCGTESARVYLANPVSAAIAAVKGLLMDPREAGIKVDIVPEPDNFKVIDEWIKIPPTDGSKVKLIKGPNIKNAVAGKPLPDSIEAEVLIKVGDDITTDHIIPAGAHILPLRSNIPAISEYVFSKVDPGFVSRAKRAKVGAIVGGFNYGQGSSREHAAIAPMFLGVKVVLAKSFARIHHDNLINHGVLPVIFSNPADEEKIKEGDRITIRDIRRSIQSGDSIMIENLSNGARIEGKISMQDHQKRLILAGGLLAYIKNKKGGSG